MENLQTCTFCNGDGFLTTHEYVPPVEYICIHCNGSGEVTKDYLEGKKQEEK